MRAVLGGLERVHDVCETGQQREHSAKARHQVIKAFGGSYGTCMRCTCAVATGGHFLEN